METNIAANDPQAAERYFESKVRYSTGPGELAHAIEHGHRAGFDFTIIDVRSPEEFAAGHLPGAVNLPEGDWSTLAGLTRDRLNVIYGPSLTSHLAARAALEFASAGFPVMELDGGIATWEKMGYAVEHGASTLRPGLTSGARGENRDSDGGRFAHEALF